MKNTLIAIGYVVLLLMILAGLFAFPISLFFLLQHAFGIR